MSKPSGFLNSTLIAAVAASGLIFAALSGGQAKADLSKPAPPPVAAEGPAKAAQCISGINRVLVVNDTTIKVTDDGGRSAVLTLSGPCLRDPSARIIIKLAPGSNSLCDPTDADLEVSLSGTIQQTCRITSVQQVALQTG